MINPFGVSLGAKAARLLARLGRAEIRPGLTEQELTGIEARFGFAFADDHRAFLAAGLPTGGAWPDWRHGNAAQLRSWLDRPVEDVVFAVAEADFWHPSWGTRPARQTDAVAGARAHLASVPQLVPVYSHRYLPAGQATFAHPVLSIRGADIIPYGYDLIDYVHQEFGGPQGPTRSGTSSPPQQRSGRISCPGRTGKDRATTHRSARMSHEHRADRVRPTVGLCGRGSPRRNLRQRASA